MPGAAVARRVAQGARGRVPRPAVEAGRGAAHRVRARLGLLDVPTLPGRPQAECPICGMVAETFLPFGHRRVEPDRRCPRCGSLERHRALWLFLVERTDLLRAPHRMLHVAPERCFEWRLRRRPALDYLTADLEPGVADVVMDITDIDRPDGTFDVVYAGHVLEHVPDDRRAMRELRRVLSPEGWAVLQVPMWGEETREDLSVTDPAERTRLYGQPDHVRMYGRDGEVRRRLEEAGFEVEVHDHATTLPPAVRARYRLRAGEDIFLCRHPRRGAP